MHPQIQAAKRVVPVRFRCLKSWIVLGRNFPDLAPRTLEPVPDHSVFVFALSEEFSFDFHRCFRCLITKNSSSLVKFTLQLLLVLYCFVSCPLHFLSSAP